MKKESFLKVKILPNSSQTKVVSFNAEEWKIKIKAPPEKGKANKELINFLSKILNTAQSNIQIILGSKSSSKLLKILGIDPTQVLFLIHEYQIKMDYKKE